MFKFFSLTESTQINQGVLVNVSRCYRIALMAVRPDLAVFSKIKNEKLEHQVSMYVAVINDPIYLKIMASKDKSRTEGGGTGADMTVSVMSLLGGTPGIVPERGYLINNIS